MATLKLNVNGEDISVNVQPDTPLLWVIRDVLKLTGTKYGCGVAQCGTCTVHLDGAPIRSCTLPASAVSDSKITTIEGLSGEQANRIQDAWIQLDVPQCGYCQSGQIMSAVALLKNNPSPSDEDIDAAMFGNICRCATYGQIRKAIKAATGAA